MIWNGEKYGGETSFVKAYLSGSSQPLTSTGEWEKIDIDAADFDYLGEFSATNNRIEVQNAGGYLIIAQIKFLAPGDQNKIHSACYINGSRAYYDSETVSGALDLILSATGFIKLNAGDYVELYGRQNGGSSPEVTLGADATYLALRRIL